MICPECNGKSEVKYYREKDRDENSVTVESFLDVCHTCHGSGVKIETNADHIRSMTDEELARMLWKTGRNYRAICADPVVDFKEHSAELVDWLKQPYKEEL